MITDCDHGKQIESMEQVLTSYLKKCDRSGQCFCDRRCRAELTMNLSRSQESHFELRGTRVQMMSAALSYEVVTRRPDIVRCKYAEDPVVECVVAH